VGDRGSWDGLFHLAGGERQLNWNVPEGPSDLQRHALRCADPERRPANS
jgi:hypothetical protein